MYLTYFLVALIVILCILFLLILLTKGYRIVYEKKDTTKTIFSSVPTRIRKMTTDVSNMNVRRTITFSRNTGSAYSYLKKDYPEFDMEQAKNDIKDYILDCLKTGNTDSKMRTTGTFKCEIEDIYQNKEIDKDSIHVIRTIIGNYMRINEIVKVLFNTEVEYTYNYENGSTRRAEKNYTSEFIYTPRNSKNKRIKCTNDCTKEKLKNTKCDGCKKNYGELEPNVWYLNKLRDN